jgi:hypothetical protein
VGRTIFLGSDQTGGAQQAEVLGDGWAARSEIASEFPDGLRTTAEQAQDFPARLVSYCPKWRIAGLVPYCNHMVTNMVTVWLQIVNEGR